MQYICLFLFVFCFNISSSQQIRNSQIKGFLDLKSTDSISNIYYQCQNCIEDSGGFHKIEVLGSHYFFQVKSPDVAFITILTSEPHSRNAYTHKNMVVLLLNGANVIIHHVDSFSNIKVKGSDAYDAYEQLEKIRAPFSKQLDSIFQKITILKTNHQQEDAINMNLNAVDSIKGMMTKRYLAFVKSNPNSPVATYAISRTFDFNYKDYMPLISRLYNQRSETEKTSYFGRYVQSYLDRKILIGKNAPNFVLPNVNAELDSLKNYNGKYVLVDFWASWCGPCRIQNHYLVNAYKQYHNKGLEMISITIDKIEDKNKWIEAIKKDSLSWTNLVDYNRIIARKYEVSGIPRNFLIDSEGKIIATDLRDERINVTLNNVFYKK